MYELETCRYDFMNDDNDERPDNGYVGRKEFEALIKEYYKTDIIPKELAEIIMKIAEGLGYNWRFIKYTKSWKEEMIGDAVVKMCAALTGKKFNVDLGYNPFSYFNQIAWHAFTNRIKKEDRQHEGLQEYKQMVYEQYMLDSEGDIYVKQGKFDDSDDDCGDYLD